MNANQIIQGEWATLAQIHRELGACLTPVPKKETLRLMLRDKSVRKLVPIATPARGGGAAHFYNRADVRALLASRIQGGAQ